VAIDAGDLDVAQQHTERLHSLLPLLGAHPDARRSLRFGDLFMAMAREDLAALRSAVDRIEPTPEELDDAEFLLAHGFVLAQAWFSLGQHDRVIEIARRGIPVASLRHEALIEAVYRLVAGGSLHHVGERELAADHLIRCLRLSVEATAGGLAAPAIQQAAEVVGATTDDAAAVAAALLGAAAVERERTGARETPTDTLDRLRRDIEERLGPATVAARAAEGAALDRAEAVARAIAALEASTG
jgi:tetratricopeptide (TPR) repeat protein